MNVEDLVKEIENVSIKIEPLMLDYVKKHCSSYRFDLCEELRYALPDVHLRVRPFLVQLGYEATGKQLTDRLLKVGAAIELMQISTLVTDDILDETPKRNNKPSLYCNYGMKDAILIGTLLKSMSTLFLEKESRKFGISSSSVMETLEKAFLDVCVGQYLDVKYEKEEDVTIEQYMEMIEKTTASFIDASLRIGALLGEGSSELLECLHVYGINFGLAYQIRDDIIDLIGEEALTGKTRYADLRRCKKRLPTIHLLSQLSPKRKNRLLEMIRTGKFGNKEGNHVLELMKTCGSSEFSMKQLQLCCRKAEGALDSYSFLPKCRSKLEDLVKIVSSIDF